MKKRILFAPRIFTDAGWMYDRLREYLKDTDIEFVHNPCSDADEIIQKGKGAEILYAYRFPVDSHIMDHIPGLKWVMSSGGGYDHIDLETATQRGIFVSNCPGHNMEAVAEFTISLIMVLSRQVCRVRDLLKKGSADQVNRATSVCRLIQGKTLGLVGFGRIAGSVCRKARALGMRVVAYDPCIPGEAVIKEGATPVSMPDLLQQADFISLHVRLTDCTRHMISTEQLFLMKKTSYLINTSRGGVVDETALLQSLTGGEIAGAALDVMETEPVSPDHPLLKLDNVIITGHIAGNVEEAAVFLVDEWWSNIRAYLETGIPGNLVNKEVAK